MSVKKEKQIKEKLYQFISANTYADGNDIHYDTLIFREGYLDSMGFITLITFLEDEFNIQAEDRDFTEKNFESINAIIDYMTQKLAT